MLFLQYLFIQSQLRILELIQVIPIFKLPFHLQKNYDRLLINALMFQWFNNRS